MDKTRYFLVVIMLEMIIDSIRVSLMNYQRVVILKQQESERYLPIWIGPSEADAIAVKLQDVSVPRPLTHDLLGSIIGTLGGKIDHIVVSDLAKDTFFAKIIISLNGTTTPIDCRPSDAIAVAVRAKVPIFVDETVLEKAGIVMDKETGKIASDSESLKEGTPGGKALDENEVERMSAFADFIGGLEGLEDLGPDNPKST